LKSLDSTIAEISRCSPSPDPVTSGGGGKVQGASLQGGKMRGTVRAINARRWEICEAGMCEAQQTTGAAGIVVGCEPLKRN